MSGRESTTAANRISYLSLANVIAAIAVITLHTNGCFWSFSTDHYWYTANIVESFFYFAVPFFFMITGALLLDFYDKYSITEYFKKRIKKTVIPFIAWTFIGIAYRIWVAKNLTTEDVSLRYIFDALTKFNIINLFWFFGPLFCVYLSIPLLASIPKEKRNTVYLYTAVASVILNVLVPFINSVFSLDIACPLSVSVGSGYLFYVLVGYLITHNDLKILVRIAAYILSVAGLLMHVVGTYKLSMEAGAINGLYKGYNNIPCILYSVGLFIAVKHVSRYVNCKFFLRGVTFIGDYTFPMYLMQWFFIDAVSRFTHINTYSLYYRLGAPIPIALLIILISWVLRKIPLVKHIVP